ncbi:MAG TPA: hypothetical protein VM867_12390, partial [Xanthobacteraceae bacterium]|nr:hypothetical protein [Xanthobacteraceae bacterium]
RTPRRWRRPDDFPRPDRKRYESHKKDHVYRPAVRVEPPATFAVNDRTGGIMYGEAGLIFQDPKQIVGYSPGMRKIRVFPIA